MRTVNESLDHWLMKKANLTESRLEEAVWEKIVDEDEEVLVLIKDSRTIAIINKNEEGEYNLYVNRQGGNTLDFIRSDNDWHILKEQAEFSLRLKSVPIIDEDEYERLHGLTNDWPKII